MTLTSLLKSPPKVHDWGSGELTSTGFAAEVFEFMEKVLTPESVSIETGIGISTAVFALKAGNHTCVSPDPNEISRFKEYSEKNKISINNITFLCKKSFEVWFNLKDNLWNFVLIDGLHGFPTPFMDWYFLSQGLKVNGYLVIDDTHISTGKTLKDFLLREDSWKIVAPLSEKTAIFQKVKDFDYNKEFIHQAYVLEQTKAINKYKKIRDFARRVKRKLEKFFF
jgi:predicted O-methyltransferase YrrM